MLESELANFILLGPGIAGLIGDRITPVVLVQNSPLPAVTYQSIAKTRLRVHGDGPTGLCDSLIQVDCWAERYNQCKTLADLIRVYLDGYKGLMGSVRVQQTILVTERDDFEDEREIHNVSMDFRITHEE
jgi:hypothetical protein